VHRVAIAFVVSTIVLLVVVGCGGSTAPITKAEAIAYAHAVNLVPADLPEGTQIAPGTEVSHPSREEARITTCARAPSLDQRVALVESPEFRIGSERERDALHLESSVVVYKTAAFAAQNFVAVTSVRGRGCLAGVLRTLPPYLRFRTTKLRDGNTASYRAGRGTVTFFTPAGLAREAIGYRVVATVTMSAPAFTGHLYGFSVPIHEPAIHAHFPLYRETVIFRVGAAEVELTVTSAHELPPSSVNHRLLLLLRSRAETHKL
jgi:hypothetical protein